MSHARIAVSSGWNADSIDREWVDAFEGEEAFAMLENPTQQRFEKLKTLKDEGVSLSQWSEGVIFSATSEIRWGKRHGKSHAVMIADNPGPTFPQGFVEEPMKLVEQASEDEASENVLLWGKPDRVDGETVWWEDRIPADMSYPIEATPGSEQRAALVYKTYGMAGPNEDTRGVMHRWCGIELKS